MIAAFIQARMASTRLPGKVLKPILGRPMLELLIERVQRCKTIDQIVVVTSTESADQPILELCERLNISTYCGSLDNVMDRFYQAAVHYQPDHIVRLTADCPLIDPRVIDQLVTYYEKADCDFATNCMPPTYPDGLDAEIFPFQLLEEAYREASLPSHLEHVTVFFEDQPERYRIENMKNDTDLSHMRWTVDELEDLEFVTQIYGALYPKKSEFLMDDVLGLTRRLPELGQINNHYLRNEGLVKSRKEDVEHQST